jgi:hypothetical protein
MMSIALSSPSVFKHFSDPFDKRQQQQQQLLVDSLVYQARAIVENAVTGQCIVVLSYSRGLVETVSAGEAAVFQWSLVRVAMAFCLISGSAGDSELSPLIDYFWLLLKRPLT